MVPALQLRSSPLPSPLSRKHGIPHTAGWPGSLSRNELGVFCSFCGSGPAPCCGEKSEWIREAGTWPLPEGAVASVLPGGHPPFCFLSRTLSLVAFSLQFYSLRICFQESVLGNEGDAVGIP